MQNEFKSNTFSGTINICKVPQNMLISRPWNSKRLFQLLFKSNESEPQKDLIDLTKYELKPNYTRHKFNCQNSRI